MGEGGGGEGEGGGEREGRGVGGREGGEGERGGEAHAPRRAQLWSRGNGASLTFARWHYVHWSSRTVGGGIGIASAFMGAGLWSLVLQQILIAAVGSLVLWVASDETPRLRFRYAEFKQLVGFGALSVSGLLLSSSIRRVFTLLASWFLGVEAAGYLDLSFRVVDVFWAIAATAVAQVALPLLAGIQFDTVRLKRAYQSSTQLSCLALYPCFVGLAAVAPDIVELLFGARWPAEFALRRGTRFSGPPAGAAAGVYTPPDGAGQAPGPSRRVACGTAVMLGVALSFGMPSLPWAIASWVASECVLLLVSSSGAATRHRLQYFGAVRRDCKSAARLLADGSGGDRDSCLAIRRLGAGPAAELAGAAGRDDYVFAIFLLDRRLVKDFLEFARAAFEGKRNRHGMP